jgi:hypothetical protein
MPDGLRRKPGGAMSLETVTAGLIFLTVTLFLTISGSFLENNGVAYQSPGGNFLIKLHPGTYMLLLTLVLVALARNPVQLITLFFRARPATATYAVVIVGLFAVTLAAFGPSGTSYMIDCLVMPSFFVLMIMLLEPESQDRLFRWVLLLVAINATIGIFEFLTKTRVTPFLVNGEEQVEEYFRATALLGHPLQNALMTSMALFALPALSDRRSLSIVYAGLYALGLIAFGGRTAIAVTAVFGGVLLAVGYARYLLNARMTYFSILGSILVALVAPVVAVALFVEFGSRSRLVQEFYWDTSAESRLHAIRIFDAVSFDDLLFGIGPGGILQQVAQLSQQTGIIGIENGWILLLLQFGLLGFLIFFIAFNTFVFSLVRGASLSIRMTVVVFLVIASSNNSLASKDSSLILLAIVASGATLYEQRRRAEAARW